MNEKTWEDCLSEGDVRNVSKDIKKSTTSPFRARYVGNIKARAIFSEVVDY